MHRDTSRGVDTVQAGDIPNKVKFCSIPFPIFYVFYELPFDCSLSFITRCVESCKKMKFCKMWYVKNTENEKTLSTVKNFCLLVTF